MKHLAFFLFCLSIASCTSAGKKTGSDSAVPAKYQKAFKTALNDLENEQYESAIKGFKNIAQKEEQGFLHLSALFNVGSAYQKLKKCNDAQKVFSEISEKSKEDSIFKVQSLMQLHYAHECLGEPEKALNALKLAVKKEDQLNETSRLVEVPARLSILYAQMKQDSQSLVFRDKAFEGIKKIKSPIKDKRIVAQTAAKLFFIMGQSLVHPDSIKMNQYLLALPHYQIYLIQSYLLEDPLWSPQAKKELKSLYEKLWLAYKKLPKNKKMRHKNQIIKVIGDFQKIAKSSHSPKLNKFLSVSINPFVHKFEL